MSLLLPLLENELLEFLKERPGAVVVAVVVLIGLFQGLGRTLKSMAQSAGGGGSGGGAGAGGGRDQFAAGNRPVANRQATQQHWGDDDTADDSADDAEFADFDNEPAPVRQTAVPLRIRKASPAPPPVATRRAAPADDAPLAILKAKPASTPVGTTTTTHSDDVSMARGLISGRRPSRDEVRTAILWTEIIGPPRALKPYRSPARRGGGSDAGPSSIAIVPLHDRPRS